MSDGLLAQLGHWARPLCATSPFTNVYGLSRTLLAVATAGTIAFNNSNVLFTPAAGIDNVPRCGSGILRVSVFCLLSPARLGIARWLSVAILLVVASGWRPRITAIPHAWLSYSFFASSSIFDGGDQITLVLTVLLLPVALLDPRRWHWSTVPTPGSSRPETRLLAWSAIYMIRLQVAAVYFVSGISKLGQQEWVNGTAMYYWLLSFGGAPRWVVALAGKPIPLVVMTWGAIALEVALAAGLLLPRKSWRPLLILGIIFHLLIALFFNLLSFAIAMIAALILYLRPADEPLQVPAFPRWNRLQIDSSKH